jgi:hypothetical protein
MESVIVLSLFEDDGLDQKRSHPGSSRVATAPAIAFGDGGNVFNNYFA